MKKVLLVLFLFANSNCFSQTIESLKEGTKKMYEATYNMVFEDVINNSYPKIFDFATREEMMTMLTSSFENETLKIRFVYPDPVFTFSEIKIVDGKHACIITYNNAMRMTFNEPFTDEKALQTEESFNDTGGYKTVRFEKDRNSFFLENQSMVIAIADVLTKFKWKFVTYDKSQNEIMKKIIGESIFNALGL